MKPPVVAFAPLSIQAPRRAVDEAQLERDGDFRRLERDGDFRRLVRALKDASSDNATKAKATECWWNLLAGNCNMDIAVAVVAAGAIPPLVELLRSGSHEPRQPVCAAKLYSPRIPLPVCPTAWRLLVAPLATREGQKWTSHPTTPASAP
jgi:hypothetical protein